MKQFKSRSMYKKFLEKLNKEEKFIETCLKDEDLLKCSLKKSEC